MSHRVVRDPDELREEDIVTLAADHPYLTVEKGRAILRYTNEWDDSEEIDLGKLNQELSAEFPDEITVQVLCEIAYVTGGQVMSEDGPLDPQANLPQVVVEPSGEFGLEAWRAHIESQRDLTPTEHGDAVIFSREVLGDTQETEFEYRGGRVFAVYPDPPTLKRLARMARGINARLMHEQKGELEIDALIGAEGAPGKSYSPKETYAAGDEISHPRFGAGTVVRARAKQIDVEFGGETRKLAHGL